MSSFKKEGAARNPKKQTRLLDAYGNFGEHEPLVLPNDPDRSAVGDLPQLDSLHASYGAARNRETTATGVTYHGNVPDHSVRSFFRHLNFVIPSRFDVVEITAAGTETMLSYRHIGEARDLPPSAPGMRRLQFRRSARRRMFLFLTEPETSKASALFFFILVITITLMNIVMMMQTMTQFQFTPDNCRSCGGTISYLFDDETFPDEEFLGDYDCVCPPTPLMWTQHLLNYLIFFFSIEWVLRLVTFEPIPIDNKGHKKETWDYLQDWIDFVTSWTTILDFLAIFPYYMEVAFQTNGLMSLRLLRLFRVMQLIRLGQYNENFLSLTSVLSESVIYLKLLIGVLLFAAAFFGSMIYWLEKGDWKYWPETQSFQFIRLDPRGIEEISPYKSIPDCFWWFFVTATTVGYGDSVPTSTMGKWVAFFAMMTGVLVIAFPVSVFSDLWSKELRRTGAFDALNEDDDEGSQRVFHGKDDEERTPSNIQLRSADSLPPADDTLTRNISYSSLPQGHIAIDREDLISLLGQMRVMQDAQKDIKAILRKYKLQIQAPSTPHDKSPLVGSG